MFAKRTAIPRTHGGPHHVVPALIGDVFLVLGARVFDTLMLWQERARTRRRLASFDDRLLSDIGLTRADVATEYDKPFWRP